MISATRTNNFRRGFSLIEIVMVLGIAALVMGGAITLMIYSSDKRTLSDASGEVEMLAKRARTIAILQQTPYALEFRQGVVKLLPLAEAGLDDDGILDDVGVTTNDDIKVETRYTPVREQVNLSTDITLSIRRWNTVDWLPIVKDNLQIWRFDPDGLCEPVSIRYAVEKGWAEDTYHPLTATIRDSQLEVR